MSSLTLREVIERLDSWSTGETIYVKRPWGPMAEAVVRAQPPDGKTPADLESAGFRYFLEVRIAREIIEDLDDTPTTLEQRVAFLQYYAQHDAFPESLDQL